MKRVSVTIDLPESLGGPREVSGWGTEVEGIPFVVTKAINKEGKQTKFWALTEPLTGRFLPGSVGDTRQEAIDRGAATIRYRGAAKVRDAIIRSAAE